MKKLIILFLSVLIFISCSSPVQENKSTWDKDGIAYTNNSDYVPPSDTNKEGSYIRTGLERKSGTSGIIGKFTKVTLDSDRLYSNVESFTFTDNGKYTWTHIVQSGNYTTTDFSASGDYNLYKYSDSYYIVELKNRSDVWFYSVSDKGILFLSSITDADNNTIYASKVINN